MGLCGKDGAEDCSKVDSSSVKWFKIEEAGTKADGTTWYQADLGIYFLVHVFVPNVLQSVQLKDRKLRLPFQTSSPQATISSDTKSLHYTMAPLPVVPSSTLVVFS